MLKTTRDVTTVSRWRVVGGGGARKVPCKQRTLPAGTWVRLISLGTEALVHVDGDPPETQWMVPRGYKDDREWDDLVDVEHPGARDEFKDPDGAEQRRAARLALARVESARGALDAEEEPGPGEAGTFLWMGDAALLTIEKELRAMTTRLSTEVNGG